jgi:hypothetical protein
MALNNFAGKVVIQQAQIYNTLGTNSILNNLLSVDIFEDIYTPYVYCEILIIDYNKLASSLPLIGEETLLIDFKTENGYTISYRFYLYQQDNGAIVTNNKAQGYSLHGVTTERAFDSAKTVSRSYKETYARIAGQIYDDFIKKDTGKEFNFEPSKSIARYIPPQISPLKAIEYCRKRAVPANNVYSPYTFFRNSRGYNFISFNSLFQMAGNSSENVKHTFGYPSPDPTADDNANIGGSSVRSDIISFEPQNKYNSVNKIDRGTYNTASYSFDLTTKQFVLRKEFNLSENKSKFQLGSVGEFNTNNFLQTFNNTRCYVEYRPTDFGIELEGTQTDFLPDAVGEMNSYVGLFGQQEVRMLLYGDSNLTSGQTITVAIYKPTDQDKVPKIDDTLSGTYLISRIRHNITFGTQNTYQCHITGIKGAMNDTLRGLQKNG